MLDLEIELTDESSAMLNSQEVTAVEEVKIGKEASKICRLSFRSGLYLNVKGNWRDVATKVNEAQRDCLEKASKTYRDALTKGS